MPLFRQQNKSSPIFSYQTQKRILRAAPIGLLLTALAFFAYSASEFIIWSKSKELNLAYSRGSLEKYATQADDPQLAYANAYLKLFKLRNRQDVEQVITLFSQAEMAQEPALRARAKYANGNVYFDLAMQSNKISEGGAHQQAVAQIELAREAYKEALRLQPDFDAAKFNLELLDRLSPEKRTQGWLAETDGVTLQPFKRNGTAMMKDNTRRGLP